MMILVEKMGNLSLGGLSGGDEEYDFFKKVNKHKRKQETRPKNTSEKKTEQPQKKAMNKIKQEKAKKNRNRKQRRYSLRDLFARAGLSSRCN